VGERTEWPFILRITRQHEDVTLKDHEGENVTLPAIKSVSIGGKPIVIDDRMQIVRAESLNRKGVSGDALDVISVVDELLAVSDRATYVLTTPAVGFEVTITNEISDLVEMQDIYLTSGLDKLRETLPGYWKYDGAVLAGVALVVSWRKKNTPTAKGA
jgi:hypothetical protein